MALVSSVAAVPSGIAGNSRPAPWDSDGAIAMFDASTPAHSAGLTPVWVIALRDSGHRIEVVRNRFSEPGFGEFPVDSVWLRRFETHVEPVGWMAKEAFVLVGSNGEPDSGTLQWVTPGPDEAEPLHVGTHPPIPLDGCRYCLSGNGKCLLVLRAMPHSVNIRGETGTFGLLDYFDVSQPKRPRRLGPPLEAEGSLDNGVVSDDGSTVAVTILPSFPSNHTKVVVLERVGKGLSAARVVSPATTASGLQFEGRFLFVGMQRSPLPLSYAFATTDTIALYDLRK